MINRKQTPRQPLTGDSSAQQIPNFTVHRSKDTDTPVAYISFPSTPTNYTYDVNLRDLYKLAKIEMVSGDIIVKQKGTVLLNSAHKEYTFPILGAGQSNTTAITVSGFGPALLRVSGSKNETASVVKNPIANLHPFEDVPTSSLTYIQVAQTSDPRVVYTTFPRIAYRASRIFDISSEKLQDVVKIEWINDFVEITQNNVAILDRTRRQHTFNDRSMITIRASRDAILRVTLSANINQEMLEVLGGGWSETGTNGGSVDPQSIGS